MASLVGPALADPRRLRFTTGRRRESWSRNVVALGLSGGFLEPLESTSIHLIQSGIARLIALFPDKRFDPIERQEYNRQMRDLYEDIRDFIILHYKATTRTDTPFWNRVRTMDIPQSLANRIALFQGKGRLFREGNELFTNTSWVAVCLGQHIVPREHEPAADALDETLVAKALEQMRQGYWETAQKMPSHAEFLARIAPQPAPPPPPAAEPLPVFSFAQDAPFAAPGSPV
jgi:tryptophan halogenase